MEKFSSKTLENLIKAEKEGNGAKFTIKSLKTGKDFSFKVAIKNYNGNKYLHCKVETEYLNFKYLGFYSNGKVIRKGEEIKTPSSLAIAWLLRNVEKGHFDFIDQNVELMHFGKCLKCGKTLTDAQSIKLGIGPVCMVA